MHNNKKRASVLVKLALFLLAVLCAPLAAAQPLDLAKTVDISFGTIDYEGSTGIGNISMGTNGNIIYGSNTSGGGIGTPGQLEIIGATGENVSLSCSTAGSLALSGQAALPITPVRFNIGASNVGSYASAVQCAGIGVSVASHTISADTADNTIFIGGLLGIDGQPLTNGVYSTAASGGTLPAFQMIVQ